MEIKNLSWNENMTNKTIILCYQRVCGAGFWANQAVVRLHCCWIFFSDVAGWTVQIKSLFEPKYKILRNGFEEQLPKEMIVRVFENRDEVQREQISPNELIHELAKKEGPSAQWKNTNEPIECNFYESADDVPDMKEISPEHKYLMIFDDLLLQKQNKCEAYYVRGRHSNCDCLYCI